MLFFNNRKEGDLHKTGFNFTKTKFGHGIQLLIFNKYIIGYYWGKKFKIWNYKKGELTNGHI